MSESGFNSADYTQVIGCGVYLHRIDLLLFLERIIRAEFVLAPIPCPEPRWCCFRWLHVIVGKPSVWILPRKKLRLSCAIRMLSTLHLLYFSWDMKHAIRATWLASPNRDRSSHLPHNFWSSYEYLIYYHRSEDSLAHLVWSYRSSPNPLNLEWVVNFELCSPISCKYMFFCCPFLASHLIL